MDPYLNSDITLIENEICLLRERFLFCNLLEMVVIEQIPMTFSEGMSCVMPRGVRSSNMFSY